MASSRAQRNEGGAESRDLRAPYGASRSYYLSSKTLSHGAPKSLPLEGGRSARKTVQWTVFSEGRAAALDGGLRGNLFVKRLQVVSRRSDEVSALEWQQAADVYSRRTPHQSGAKILFASNHPGSAPDSIRGCRPASTENVPPAHFPGVSAPLKGKPFGYFHSII